MIMRRNEHEIETDITVYGATSFTAKHVLRYLMQYIILQSSSTNKDEKKKGKSLRVTLAGRNFNKLDKLFKSQEFQTSSSVAGGVGVGGADLSSTSTSSIFHDIYVASGDDFNALQCMSKRTRVVLNCAGPFALHSNLVVEACATTGTDYVDITGEGNWGADMRHQHGTSSKESGSRIISFCGYDSIPSDICLYMAVTTLRERLQQPSTTTDGKKKTESIPIESAELWHTSAGFPSSGTLRTMAGYPIDLINDFLYYRRRDSDGDGNGNSTWSIRWIPFFLNDSLLLTHPQLVRNVKGDPDYDIMRNQFAWNEWMNQFPIKINIPFNFGISIPFLMSPINMYVYKVVHLFWSISLCLNFCDTDIFAFLFVFPTGKSCMQALWLLTMERQ